MRTIPYEKGNRKIGGQRGKKEEKKAAIKYQSVNSKQSSSSACANVCGASICDAQHKLTYTWFSCSLAWWRFMPESSGQVQDELIFFFHLHHLPWTEYLCAFQPHHNGNSTDVMNRVKKGQGQEKKQKEWDIKAVIWPFCTDPNPLYYWDKFQCHFSGRVSEKKKKKNMKKWLTVTVQTIWNKRKDDAIAPFVTLQTQHQEVLCRGMWQSSSLHSITLLILYRINPSHLPLLQVELHSVCTEIKRDCLDLIWFFISTQVHLIERWKFCNLGPADLCMAWKATEVALQTLIKKTKL